MDKSQDWTVRERVFAAIAITVVLLLNGAIPFLMTPTLGQAIWTTGFSQSFANGSLYNIYAHDFGIPKPAPIAFGLSGALFASLLIRFGFSPADAYSGMVAFWLSVAFISAYQIVRFFGGARSISLLGSLTWMSMPIIWGHAVYSQLSLGIGLLAFYFLAALKLFCAELEINRVSLSTVLFNMLVVIIAVFMDGYSFMMFATGTSILLVFIFISKREKRAMLLWKIIPIHIASFSFAYTIYASYIGKLYFEPAQMDFFRGWGLDLSFLVLPTKGVHWLPDLLDISVPRSDKQYFGDASVWTTTFSLPLLIIGIVTWLRNRRRIPLITGVLLVAAFGFYMALGPSLKINSIKPDSLSTLVTMPADLAVMPTGSAWISEKLPGFNGMRASYRWSALGVFSVWLMIIISIAHDNQRNRFWWMWALAIIVICNIPHVSTQWKNTIEYRNSFKLVDQNLISEFRKKTKPGEIVSFIPWGNDFFANYLASRTGFRTFNIGGDKNLAMAQTEWPAEMIALSEADINYGNIFPAIKMLVYGTTDVVVIPYFNLLWSAHLWPCIDETKIIIQEQFKAGIPSFFCPAEQKIKMNFIVNMLQEQPFLDVVDSDLFATIRLRPAYSGPENKTALIRSFMRHIHYPITLNTELKDSSLVLTDGWYPLEPNYVWSKSNAKLTLPVPKDCDVRSCEIVLKFGVFSSSPQRPVSIYFSLPEIDGNWNKEINSNSSDTLEVSVPLHGSIGSQQLSISIPNATSPQALSSSKDADSRVLGIALQRIELKIM
jgi:hypothetical protein